MSEPALLELRDVTRSFDSSTGPATEVLRGISLRVAERESLAIVGPSGSGKSTLLSLMGGLDRPTSGQVLLEGEDLARLGSGELARVRSQEIGFVFQVHHLLPQCSALENVLVPTLVHGSAASRARAAERGRALLERVGLAHRLDHRPGELSLGECQRVAVVRALIQAPRLLLADEPTGSLDRSSAESLAELLGEIHREDGVALVVATHSERLSGRMERVLRLEGGRLVPEPPRAA